jgi:hypothetical protein
MSRPWTAWLWLLLVLAPRLSADEPSPTPSPTPSPSILASVQRAVDQLGWKPACQAAEHDGVPCFPSDVERAGERYSVAESLNHIDTDGPRPPGPPTGPEMLARLQWNAPGRVTLPFFVFDPFCTGRSVAKWLKGKNDTYYVYRMVDAFGPRAAMYEKPIAPETYSQAPAVSYERIGEYKGECDALTAYRKTLRGVSVASGSPSWAGPTPPPRAGSRPRCTQPSLQGRIDCAVKQLEGKWLRSRN